MLKQGDATVKGALWPFDTDLPREPMEEGCKPRDASEQKDRRAQPPTVQKWSYRPEAVEAEKQAVEQL
jgi:hypothetical protein